MSALVSVPGRTRVLGYVLLAFAGASGVALAANSADTAQVDALRADVDRARSDAQRVQAMWALTDALEEQGQLLEAQRVLQRTAELALDPEQKHQTALRLANVLAASGQAEEAAQALALAKPGSDLSSTDRLLWQQATGGLAVRNGDLVLAEQSFEAEADQAHTLQLTAIEIRSRLNALRARIDRDDIAGLEERLSALDTLVATLPGGQERALLEISVGELYARAVREFRSDTDLRARAYADLTRGRSEATAVSTRAYAVGLLGGLYEDESRFPEALRLTGEAIFLAQSVDAQDQLYRWEWQAGRLQRKLGERAASAQSLDRALFTLSAIRQDVLKSSRQAYSTSIEPLYLDYANVRLLQAAGLPEGSDEQQRMLRDVRDQLESLKQAEVQDYFESSCATGDANGAVNVPDTAVIYPIIFADRTEVLVETGGMLRRYAASVSKTDLTNAVRRLRLSLERPTSGDQYLAPAQSLYEWLLKDPEAWLASHKVTTLVFVPSGPLRTIPLAALHDGHQFVIERYAVATTPAISLIPTLMQQPAHGVLVAGLTKSVQGFDGLPSVDEEIHSIDKLYPTAESLEDETFRLSTLRDDLSKPGISVAHLATHGTFSADHRQSFVLTYDSKLTLDGLQSTLGRREEPLDLLVLSACSTAAGDDRAALGLAGVAVQSGARSALASLWSISDQATAALMANFYQSRKAGTQSKAQSLRSAQLALLGSPQYHHPSYWAPYLMIGNWL